jgi:predicted nucleic acid-binding protein
LDAFIDTNILIYAMELHPTFGERALKILEQVDRGSIKGYISTLVLLEVCWYIEASGNIDEMKNALENIEDSRLETIEVQHSDITGAVELKTDHKEIDLNDLVHYQVMKRRGITDVFTNDSHFKILEDIRSHFKDNPI